MGKKKGKKGKTQDSEPQSSDTQQAGSSTQQPAQPVREEPPKQGGPEKKSEKELEPKPVGRGKGRQPQQQAPRRQPVQTAASPHQGQGSGQPAAVPQQRQEPGQPAGSAQQWQGPGQPVAVPQQRQGPGQPAGAPQQWQGPGQPAAVPQQRQGPGQSGQLAHQPKGPWSSPGQPAQPAAVPQQLPQFSQLGTPWGPRGQPAQKPSDMSQQPRATPSPVEVSRQGGASESSSTSVSSEKQPEIQKAGGAKQKSPQKGKQKGPQQTRPQQLASTSRESPTSQFSQMQIFRPDIGQGDVPQLLPMVLKRVQSGTKGRKIMVETNHLSLNLGKLKTAIHYDVNLVPDTPKKFLRDVLELFRQKHYNKRYPAFDGKKNLYSSSALPFGEFIADEITIQEPNNREKKFKVEIKFANYVDLTPLQDLLKSEATPREALQVVDIVLRSAPATACISVGRSFFIKPPTIIELGEGMEMYSGFFQSAIRGWKPFLNVDVAHKAFPKDIKMIDVLLEILGDYYRPFTRENLNRPLSQNDEAILNKFIKTLRVSYEIPRCPATKRVYRVNGIDEPPRRKMFKLDSGESITIEKYFEKHKNYRLQYPLLPSIWVGAQNAEKKILLPLELCTIVEGQVVNRKMTENQTSAMIKYSATNTAKRKEKIMASLQHARHNDHPSVKEFGFSIGNEFEKLQARILQPPALMYANNKPVTPSRGIWRGERFFNGVKINKWTIACVDRRPARAEDTGNLASMIQKNAESCGMFVTSAAEKPFANVRAQTPDDLKRYFLSQKEKQYDVIFVIVPNSGPQYSYVKTAAEINVGCLTQCIKAKTLNKLNVQTVVNILLKVNTKLNGTNHYLQTRPPIMNRPCMIMGADVTHPSPDAKEIPSVAAVTASHDPKAFQYNICWRLQPPKVEIIEDLEAIVIEQLKYFEQKNRVKPERIVFFRDGVSEGQFEQVRNAEIRAIRSACKKLQQDKYEPAITFLVVQKRHHTRLFPTNPGDSEDKNCNVPAGTCVDTTITHPFMQDFYLVSHASIQGVARPTKYCTLWDDNSMSNDDIEELTYFLCHMFTRCNRSVSYPAPTYYAHLAAARAKVYIENVRLNMDQLPREYLKYQIQEIVRKGNPMFFV